MSSIKLTLTALFTEAITQSLPGSAPDPLIHISSRPELSDYQANFALSLAKRQNRDPLMVANTVVAALATNPLFASLTVSSPGFINIRLANTFLDDNIRQFIDDADCLSSKVSQPKTIVVDYGGANVAKEMHVGHLRSAVIGDAIARILMFVGHRVIRQNHLGDWGTQFGMLIEYSLDENIDLSRDVANHDLNTLYQQAKEKFDRDENFVCRARQRVVLLQSNEPLSLKIWQALVTQSESYFHSIYSRLNVLLSPADNRGESFYNSLLPGLIDELLTAGSAQLDQGAVVIPLAGFTSQDNQPLPLLIRKTDGGYLYATTDLAAARFRLQDLQADNLIYVTDVRQKLHFTMLAAALQKLGWITATQQFNHLAFGTVLAADKKPFKTRSGATIKLIDLLDEAESRALQAIAAHNANLDKPQHAAQVIGIGALKYADLANDLGRDYVFDWDKMLAFEGNTAPYLQNAYVRIQAIFRKGQLKSQALATQSVRITTLEERILALKVLEFNDVVHAVASDLRPHKLCTYLFELATKFHRFYEACPILQAGSETRYTRLLLVQAVAKALKIGLGLLGIDTLERM